MRDIFIGKTVDGYPLKLTRAQRTEHVQIIGSTGRGKTYSVLLPWAIQDFVQGQNVIVIDGKGDRKIFEEILRFAEEPEDVIVFDVSDPEGSSTTNPLKFGSPQQIADRIFTTFEFENSYYETVSYEAVLMVIELLRKMKKEVTFKGIYQALCNDEVLTALVTQGGGSHDDLRRLALAYLAEPFRDRKERLSGFLSQLRPLAIGELSELVNGKVEGRSEFSLSELIRMGAISGNSRGKAIVVLISSLLYQKSAARIGQMFLQEIAWASALRISKAFCPVFLDEFSAFVYEGFLQLLNKARSSNIALHLSHQSMGDLEAISIDFAKAVVVNTNIKCVLGVNEPETAEFFARLFGTKGSQKTTERAEKKRFGDVEMSGLMSVRDVEEYRIHPNRLKSFSKGQGVLSFMNNGEMIIEEVRFEPAPGGI